MREPYGRAVAPRAGGEPWRCVREDMLQALVAGRVGWVLNREIFPNSGRRGYSPSPKTLLVVSLSLDTTRPRAVEDPTHARKLFAQELGDPLFGPGKDGALVRVVNPAGARRR